MNELLSPETAAPVQTASKPDPIRELERLRAANQRWRKAATGAVVAFVFLFVVSLVQFLGTFITCRLLHEARQEAARNRQDTMKALGEMKEAQHELEKTQQLTALAVLMVKARTELEQLMSRLGAVTGELAAMEAREKLGIGPDPTLTMQKRQQELAAEQATLAGKISKLRSDIAALETRNKN